MPIITLVLHNIRSTHNVGSIFRSADGLGISRIVLTGYTPYPSFDGDTRLPHIANKITTQIDKTALGATGSVPFEQHDNILTWLDTTTLPLVALEQASTSVVLKDFEPSADEFALLLGEEVSGIEPWLLERCETILEIPMKGSKESFNVSVAAAIAMYELTR